MIFHDYLTYFKSYAAKLWQQNVHVLHTNWKLHKLTSCFRSNTRFGNDVSMTTITSQVYIQGFRNPPQEQDVILSHSVAEKWVEKRAKLWANWGLSPRIVMHVGEYLFLRLTSMEQNSKELLSPFFFSQRTRNKEINNPVVVRPGVPVGGRETGPCCGFGWTTPHWSFEKEKRRRRKIKGHRSTMFYSLSRSAALTARPPTAREMSDLRFVYSIVPPKWDWSQTWAI